MATNLDVDEKSGCWMLRLMKFQHTYLCNRFLAAMSSSRSDDVTKFVRLLVSLVFYLVLKGLNGVSRKF